MARLLEPHVAPLAFGIFDDGEIWTTLMPVIGTDAHRAQAVEIAATRPAGFRPFTALLCVATFDTTMAFDLARAALRAGVKGREILPPRMLQWDPARLVDTLLTHLPEEYSGIVRWSIGRVLRWSTDLAIPARIAEMQGASSSLVREAAFDLAGWRLDGVRDECIRKAALTDPTPTVRLAALDALRRRMRLRQAADLLERFVASTGSQSWLYAEALIAYVDPHVLTHTSDPLCIWRALESKDRTLRVTAQRWLEEHAKALVREAEREDFARDRSDR